MIFSEGRGVARIVASRSAVMRRSISACFIVLFFFGVGKGGEEDGMVCDGLKEFCEAVD